MTTLPPSSPFTRRLTLILAACGALALQARADEWTSLSVPTPPPGTNTAVFPMPRVEWLTHFERNVDRSRKEKVDLIFDGDSITDFWEGTGKATWAKNYVPLHPADFAISGDRTEHLLWRLEHGQVTGLHPKMIALMIGTNNTGGNTDVEIAAGVTAVVREYQKLCPDAVILLQAIFPRSQKPTDPIRAKIASINTMISKLDDGKKVIYVDFGAKFLEPDGTLTRDIMPDFLHPDAKGYEIWADAIRPQIEKVFGPTPPAS